MVSPRTPYFCVLILEHCLLDLKEFNTPKFYKDDLIISGSKQSTTINIIIPARKMNNNNNTNDDDGRMVPASPSSPSTSAVPSSLTDSTANLLFHSKSS
jgi:hypothetical protein